MLRNRLYYGIKPLLPASIRLGVRRWFALRKRERTRDVWPILPGSERPPAGWPGWPDGKQFAFVLTHDVEGPEGLKKVKRLAELEMSLGFRSCFNFIPEGGYEVPSELRHWLVNHGFEVGVHDLKHDGRLFGSRQEFERCAPRINDHLQEWGAAGFRSGFMLRNLDWLHELNLLYDASTFDTDPFEPQPEGTGTIFPFWVSHPNLDRIHTLNLNLGRAPGTNLDPTLNSQPSTPNVANGYVELPYTLAQDSTLFLLLREPTPAIWLRKLDWVARNGGMALLITHPDYINFAGSKGNAREYPAAHYWQFLGLLKQQYDGKFWHALPKEVARFCRESSAGGCIVGKASCPSPKETSAATQVPGPPVSQRSH